MQSKGISPQPEGQRFVFFEKLHSAPHPEQKGDVVFKKLPPMGTPAWSADVFNLPPARRLKGHWRRTQWHGYGSSGSQVITGVQGRNELCSALALEYLARLRYIKRFKPQPFFTNKDEFEAEICPDFLAEGNDSLARLYVIEAKTARFLTRLKRLDLDQYRDRFSACGITYLVWTDEWPLNHSVRHNLINMRAGTQRNVTPDEVEKLVAWVREQASPPLLEQLYARDFDLDCLYTACWEGKAFIPLTRPLTAATEVTCSAQEDYEAIFLGCRNTLEDWWLRLPAY